MDNYLGIVIKQSFMNQDALQELNIISSKKLGSWDFLFVSVDEGQLNTTIEKIQQSMINIDDDCWYNHFFKDGVLIIVFQDKVFKVTTNPGSWNDVIQYGLEKGIPRGQLDFKPRTLEDAYKFFEVKEK